LESTENILGYIAYDQQIKTLGGPFEAITTASQSGYYVENYMTSTFIGDCAVVPVEGWDPHYGFADICGPQL
jgi:hypothetical protein